MPAREDAGRPSGGSQVQSRLLDSGRLACEFARLARFHAQLGVPGVGPKWWDEVGRTAWHGKNPEVYRVYERKGRIAGFLGVAPLTRHAAAALLSGTLSPWWQLGAEHVLGPRDFARARFFGCSVLIDAYLARDPEADSRMRWDLRALLGRTRLEWVIAHSSDQGSEARCRGVGLRPVADGPRLPSGCSRRLWAASPEDHAGAAWPEYGEKPYLWWVFDEMRSHFECPALLQLTAREQEVAYLHYCEGAKLPAVARRLGVRVETVRSHLKSIRRKMGSIAGLNPGGPQKDDPAQISGFIRSYLLSRPGEVWEARSLLRE